MPARSLAACSAELHHQPGRDRHFDRLAGFAVLPYAVVPSAQERSDIRSNVVLAKDLKRSVAWRNSMMDKIVDSLFGKADAGIPAQQGEAGP